MYIGGTEVDSEAEIEVRSFIEMNKTSELVGVLDLNGARFSIKDVKNDYGNSEILIGGGSKVK